jgi:hypothetical protein
MDRPGITTMNVNLNAGGIFRGIFLLCVGVGLSFVSMNPAFHDRMATLTIIGVICGALVGNSAWSLFFFGPYGKQPRIETGNYNMTACPMCGSPMLESPNRCSSCGERPKDLRDSA